MDFGKLISMDVDAAERALQAENVPYTVKLVDTFKLDSYDTLAVTGCKADGDGVVLYVCRFKCGATDEG